MKTSVDAARSSSLRLGQVSHQLVMRSRYPSISSFKPRSAATGWPAGGAGIASLRTGAGAVTG